MSVRDASLRGTRIQLALVASLSLIALGGCQGIRLAPFAAPLHGAYDYFSPAPPGDAWSRKIGQWQRAEQSDLPGPAATAAGEERPGLERDRVGDLREKYDAFRVERRRALARDVAEWIQTQAQAHYVPDGAVDHWATLEETLQSNGDDCDGLELLTFNFLRELGFPEDQVFRSIVVRQSDGQHHMVTLWFEDPEDPWVIDPTGAMTSGMPRMSQVPEWVPLKVFSPERDYTVRDRMLVSAHP